MAPEAAYLEIARRKQEEQRRKIPAEWLLPQRFRPTSSTRSVIGIVEKCGILSDREIQITRDHDATSLLAELKSGRLSSVEVTRAYCKRAALAHQLVNCLTEINFDGALERAAHLDEYFKREGKPIGELHGLPISLKDTFRIPGLDASIGIAALAFQPSTTASTLTQLLLDSGAVLHCKTNVPQTLTALDSHNWLFGRTLNPYNLACTAGGSSGGEGALVAMRGSALGVGTDVGGSIRVPAMCDGIYGFKPSCGRVPYGGQTDGRPELMSRLGLQACAGPLANSIRDCELFMRAVSAAKPWETAQDVLYGPWDTLGSLSSPRKARIGIVRRDGLIEPLPPIQRLMDEVAGALRSSGVDVVEMDITSVFKQAQSASNALLGIEGGNSMFDLIESTGEPLSPWLATRLKRGPVATLHKARELQARRARLEEAFLRIWKDAQGDIDAFVCPVTAHPVPLHDHWNGVSYTITFNLLDYPAGVVPVRSFTEQDLRDGSYSMPSQTLGSWDARNRDLWKEGYDKSQYVGTPLCVQVVAPKLQEKRLYEAMALVDEAVKSSNKAAKARL